MFKFLQGLDKDLQQVLLMQLRDLWTHTSTALEGNTLTLGDTHFVLEEGLTVSGKPLKDHQEVIGHASAIELLYAMLGRDINENDIFELHRAVQTEKVSDIYKPYGGWKVEPNGTYVVDDNEKQVYIEFSQPMHVSALMNELIHEMNSQSRQELTIDDAPGVYAKIHMGCVHIHPFWDGNGRVARLLSNIPLLNSGLPPIVIKREQRREYIRALANYQLAVGMLTNTTGVWPQREKLDKFVAYCGSAYCDTHALIQKAFGQQQKRNA